MLSPLRIRSGCTDLPHCHPSIYDLAPSLTYVGEAGIQACMPLIRCSPRTTIVPIHLTGYYSPFSPCGGIEGSQTLCYRRQSISQIAPAPHAAAELSNIYTKVRGGSLRCARASDCVSSRTTAHGSTGTQEQPSFHFKVTVLLLFFGGFTNKEAQKSVTW